VNGKRKTVSCCHIILSAAVTLFCQLLSNYSVSCCNTILPAVVRLFCQLLSHYSVSCCHTILPAAVTLFCQLLSHYSASCCHTILSVAVTLFCQLLSHYSVSCCHVILLHILHFCLFRNFAQQLGGSWSPIAILRDLCGRLDRVQCGLAEGAVQPVFLNGRHSVFTSSHRVFSRRPMLIRALNTCHA
jgi:hypothetical protein